MNGCRVTYDYLVDNSSQHDDFDRQKHLVPDEETRKIQASMYKKLMQGTLTIDDLEKWNEHIDKYIIIPGCFGCRYVSTPYAVERHDPDPDFVERTYNCILKGKCYCNNEGYLDEGHKLVHFACTRENCLPILKYLKSKNCDFNVKCSGNSPTPLHLAILHGLPKTVDFLINNCDVDASRTSNEADRPLAIAIKLGNDEIVNTLLRCHKVDKNISVLGHCSLLEICIGSKYLESVLEAGADPNKHIPDSMTNPIIYAVQHNDDSLKLLIKYGADVNMQIDGEDKLLLAAMKVHHVVLENIKTLLQAGADPKCTDKFDDTPLHYLSYNGIVRGVELVIEHGADPNSRSTYKATPLWNAVYKGQKEVVKLLIKQNVILEVPSTGRKLNSLSYKFFQIYKSPKSPLWVAMDRGFSDIALLLISTGYDIYKEGWLVDGLFPSKFDERICCQLSQYVQSPPNLIVLCRKYFRRCFGHEIVSKLEQMEMPVSLKKYLTFSDLQYHVNAKDSIFDIPYERSDDEASDNSNVDSDESDSSDEW